MADKYISREWLLKNITDYKNLNTWNTDVCDGDTVLRVLEVIENLVKGAPDIGTLTLGNKVLAAKNMALDVYLKLAKDHLEESRTAYRVAESKGQIELMGFYKGVYYEREAEIQMLESLLQNG